MSTQPRTRTRLDPEIRRQQIAEAAGRIFSRHELAEVSFEAVADEAGVSRSLVYSYFGDRGGLFAAAYRHERTALEAEVDREMDALGDAPPRVRLEHGLRAYLRFADEHRSRWWLISSAGTSRHPSVRRAVTEHTDRMAETLGGSQVARVVVRAVRALLEAAATEMVEGTETRGTETKGTETEGTETEGTAADPEELAELLTQVIWAGLRSLDGLADRGGRANRS